MPKRQNVHRLETPEVQGDDSFIEVRSITYGDALLIRKNKESDDPEKIALVEGIVAKSVSSWNWVDDNDDPLPLPSADPAVIKRLTPQEYRVVVQLLVGDAEKRKN